MFTTVARFRKSRLENDAEAREKMESIRSHLEGLALDLGFAPEENIKVEDLSQPDAGVDPQDEVRIGISQEMDEFLREAPGDWRYY